MKSVLKMAFAAGLGAASAVTGMTASTPAQAQDASQMSCSQLWYARNKIYADHGFCFKSDRAIRVFGAGCFAPYGRISAAWKERVDDLQYWEARRGCPR